MGAVYRAFRLDGSQEVAIKVLTAAAASKKSVAARFVLEAQAAARIGHPGILDVYDVGEDEEGKPFIVMELLHGEPLSALTQRGPMAPELASWVAVQLLEILVAAHRADVVHRDVKPQNVFVVAPQPKDGETDDGTRTIKLLDFGIAKFHLDPDVSAITGTGEVIGSPLYMAPEQALGESDIDGRADVWSVGMLLFEMLTGSPAHLGNTPAAVITKILTEEAPLASSRHEGVPRALDELVARALVIDRKARLASASAMLDALKAARAKYGWPVVPPSFLPAPPRRRGRRNLRAVVALVILASAAVLPWLLWGRS